MPIEEDIKFATGVVLEVCFRTLLQYFLLGLIIGAALFLSSFFQTPARADYFRWMSVAIVVITTSAGALQAMRVLVRYGINRWRNRDT
jgi:hypothetical protein